MYRNILLRTTSTAHAAGEVRRAARQYVRKISGCTKPLRINAKAFGRAVDATAGKQAAQATGGEPQPDAHSSRAETTG